MTVTIAPQEAHAQPRRTDGPPITSTAAAARQIRRNCLGDNAVGRVGIELEAHCVDLDDPYRRPGWQEICDVIGSLPELPGRSLVSVEPGGAVELSGPPWVGAVSAIMALMADRATLRAAFARAGLGLVLLGADPLRAPLRVNPGARYRAMEQYFAAAHTGAAGTTVSAPGSHPRCGLCR
jgi:glutamate--cysteine ligase